MAEISSALVVACLPCLSRLFRRSGDKPSSHQAYRSSSNGRSIKRQRQWWSVAGTTHGVEENDERSYIILNEAPNTSTAAQLDEHIENNAGVAITTPFAVPKSGINRTVVIKQTVEGRDRKQEDLGQRTGATPLID